MKVNSNHLFSFLRQQMQIGTRNSPYQRIDMVKRMNRDSYVSSNQKNSDIEGKWIKGTSISDSLLDLINFERQIWDETQDEFTIAGMRFSKDQIPRVDEKRCLEITAKNNAIVIDTGKYYKFKGEDGKTHVLVSGPNNHISAPYSDMKNDILDEESNQISDFWNYLSSDPTFISLHIPEDKQRQLLNEAGIKEGFFSVQVGTKKREYFYSKGTISGAIIKKSRYDEMYDMFKDRDGLFLNQFDSGSVFKIGGKEYVLSADKKLDIPYGEDLYDIVYPKANW